LLVEGKRHGQIAFKWSSSAYAVRSRTSRDTCHGRRTARLASGQALAADAQVKIANFTFDPPTLTVKAGTTVTWVNADDIPHLVSEKDGKFRSSALDTNDKFSQTFSTAGTVEYFCAIHPHMTGKIVVTP
jgi:amicyanin